MLGLRLIYIVKRTTDDKQLPGLADACLLSVQPPGISYDNILIKLIFLTKHGPKTWHFVPVLVSKTIEMSYSNIEFSINSGSLADHILNWYISHWTKLSTAIKKPL